MKIKFPNVTQEDLEYAVECLEVCKQEHADSRKASTNFYGMMRGERIFRIR